MRSDEAGDLTQGVRSDLTDACFLISDEIQGFWLDLYHNVGYKGRGARKPVTVRHREVFQPFHTSLCFFMDTASLMTCQHLLELLIRYYQARLTHLSANH